MVTENRIRKIHNFLLYIRKSSKILFRTKEVKKPFLVGKSTSKATFDQERQENSPPKFTKSCISIFRTFPSYIEIMTKIHFHTQEAKNRSWLGNSPFQLGFWKEKVKKYQNYGYRNLHSENSKLSFIHQKIVKNTFSYKSSQKTVFGRKIDFQGDFWPGKARKFTTKIY
jgi:hypothetical protein